MDVILRRIEQVNAEYFAWFALPSSGIACFPGKFDVYGSAASVLTRVQSTERYARPVALRVAAFLQDAYERFCGGNPELQTFFTVRPVSTAGIRMFIF